MGERIYTYVKAAMMFAGVAVGTSYVSVEPAKCLYCPTYKCYQRCSRDCMCVTSGGSGGQCVGVQFASGYLEHGYKELP